MKYANSAAGKMIMSNWYTLAYREEQIERVLLKRKHEL